MSPALSDRTLSVVMPVHNALPHLDAAVRSILEQTHRDFEFVILDDASTDGSTERLKEWAAKDERIRLHLGKKNLGPAASSNFVVRERRAPHRAHGCRRHLAPRTGSAASSRFCARTPKRASSAACAT